MSTALTGDPPHSRFQAGTHRKASQRWNKTASSSEQHSVEHTQPHSVHVDGGPVTKMATDPASRAQRAQQSHSHHEEQSFKNQREHHKKTVTTYTWLGNKSLKTSSTEYTHNISWQLLLCTSTRAHCTSVGVLYSTQWAKSTFTVVIEQRRQLPVHR